MPLRYALLALLADGEAHGYQLLKRSDSASGRSGIPTSARSISSCTTSSGAADRATRRAAGTRSGACFVDRARRARASPLAGPAAELAAAGPRRDIRAFPRGRAPRAGSRPLAARPAGGRVPALSRADSRGGCTRGLLSDTTHGPRGGARARRSPPPLARAVSRAHRRPERDARFLARASCAGSQHAAGSSPTRLARRLRRPRHDSRTIHRVPQEVPSCRVMEAASSGQAPGKSRGRRSCTPSDRASCRWERGPIAAGTHRRRRCPRRRNRQRPGAPSCS